MRRRVLDEPINGFQDFAFSPDGARFAVADQSSLRVWNVSDRKLAATISKGPGFHHVAFTRDESVLITSYSSSVALWSLESGEQLRELGKHSENINDLTVSPDGEVVATAGKDKTVILWRISNGQKLATFGPFSREPTRIKFNKDGNRLAVIADGKLYLYGAAVGK